MSEPPSESEIPFLSQQGHDKHILASAFWYSKSRNSILHLSNLRLLCLISLASSVISIIGTVAFYDLVIIASTGAPYQNGGGILPGLQSIPPLGGYQHIYKGQPSLYMPDDNDDENSTRRAWMSLFPPGMGYVSMNKIRDAGEVPLVYKHMETDGSGRFCVAAFHQLHCLFLIHVALQRAVLRGGDLPTLQQPEKNLEESHTLHCIDYLRESIMCTADNNLEPFQPETEGKGVDGFGSVHQCRDWGTLFDWSKRFRYNDRGDAEKFEG